MGAVHVRNMNEGRGIIAPGIRTLNMVLLSMVWLIVASRLSTLRLSVVCVPIWQTNLSISSFQDHSRRYGLEGMDEVEIYQHRLVQENLMAYRKDQEILQRDLENPEKANIKDQTIAKMRANSERFIRFKRRTKMFRRTCAKLGILRSWFLRALLAAHTATTSTRESWDLLKTRLC